MQTCHTIVIGNEKGGSGKSTTAMHLIVALLRTGRSVASIDLDRRQGSLTRFLDNRRAHGDSQGIRLPMPDHISAGRRTASGPPPSDAEKEKLLKGWLRRLRRNHSVIVIDTPGNDDFLTRLGHFHADTLITPLNDSLMDLDVLARVEGKGMTIDSLSHYAEMVWEQKMKRVKAGGAAMEWIVVRNRLSSLDARNKREMERLLGELAPRIGFRLVSGFGERVIYRELFAKGLTMMDLREVAGEEAFSLSHVAARQEVRNLVDALDLPVPAQPTAA